MNVILTHLIKFLFFHTATNTRSDTNIILSSMLLVAVLCLVIINGLLYYKLWGLEEAAAYTIMDLHVLKYVSLISFICRDIALISYVTMSFCFQKYAKD